MKKNIIIAIIIGIIVLGLLVIGLLGYQDSTKSITGEKENSVTPPVSEGKSYVIKLNDSVSASSP